MTEICGPEQLSDFRKKFTGAAVLDLLGQCKGRLRINLAIGVGKSSNIDATIEQAIFSRRYDLVIALFPTRQIIEERRWVKCAPGDVKIVNLKPRPQDKCGVALNKRWYILEKNGLGILGRVEICGYCPCRFGCPWPSQFGRTLEGAQVIFGAQSHIERSPDFLDQLVRWSGANKVLVIFDEANFIMKPFQRSIKKKQLELFVRVLRTLPVTKLWQKNNEKWLYLCNLLLSASSKDLRSYEWQMPNIIKEWSLEVQSQGYALHGDSFFFIAFDLVHFCRSSIESRERTDNGDILYAAVPNVATDFIIYSGTVHQQFAEYRFGNEFANPYKNYSFSHPQTTWTNIASRLGAKKYFKKNSPQILDFFTKLVVRRLEEGKRPLLIAKKCFVPFCAFEINKKLLSMSTEFQVVTDSLDADLLSNPKIIPLINFGMIGTNLFEAFDCAYCLTGYYVTKEAINGILQDLLNSDMNIPLRITTEGYPCRRRASVLNEKDRYYDVQRLAQHALNLLEMDTVLQAVGRVRPYTKPREIITFQCSEHPDRAYTNEFFSVEEARENFGINSKRSAQIVKQRELVQRAKTKGLTQRQAAEDLGVCLRTVQRYWKM